MLYTPVPGLTALGYSYSAAMRLRRIRGGEIGSSANDLRQHICLPSLAELQSDLIIARRESMFLRYRANTEALQELLQFLYAECCTRNRAVKPQEIVQIAGESEEDTVRTEARLRDFACRLRAYPWAIHIPPRCG